MSPSWGVKVQETARRSVCELRIVSYVAVVDVESAVMALRRGLNAAAGLRLWFAVLTLLRLSHAFQFVPKSGCASVCRDGTLTEDAVCLDAEYRNTDGGRKLESCVGCLLNSTAVDAVKNETDVEFGLRKTLREEVASAR